MASKQKYVDEYHEQGYVVVDDAVDPDMLDELEAAGRRVRDKIRDGEVDVYSTYWLRTESPRSFGDSLLPSTASRFSRNT